MHVVSVKDIAHSANKQTLTVMASNILTILFSLFSMLLSFISTINFNFFKNNKYKIQLKSQEIDT